jgi:hypothetical protein
MFAPSQKNRDQAFSFELVRKTYLDYGISADEYDKMIERTKKVQALNISGLNWNPMDQALSEWRDLPIELHYEATANGFWLPYMGVENFYRQQIELGNFAHSVLNRTLINQIPSNAQNLPIGELLVTLGLITNETLYSVLGVQNSITFTTGVKPLLALIFAKKSTLSAHDLFQALAIQNGIEYQGLHQVNEIGKAINKTKQKAA